MNEIPGLRIVGGASDKVKIKAKEEIERRLTHHIETLSEKELSDLKRLEYPKSPIEVALIRFVNEETNRLIDELGLKPYDVPEVNFHIIPKETYSEIAGSNSTGLCIFKKQVLLFNASKCRGNNVFFGSVAFHECLHLKGHTALEISENETSLHREGVTVHSPQIKDLSRDYHNHFHGLHEAIVAEQEKRSSSRMMDTPELESEKTRMSSKESLLLKESIAKKLNIPTEDVLWVGDSEKEYETFGYEKQREVLSYVCKEISTQLPEEYPTPDDVFKEFLRAHFTGRLLPIARLIEGTFGKGSFRLLGDMKSNRESGVITLEALRKSKLRNK